MEKNRHVNKAFCGGIGNSRTLVACVKGKAPVDQKYQKKQWREWGIVSCLVQKNQHPEQAVNLENKKTVWKILRQQLHFKQYRMQLLQQLKLEDYARQLDFCINMQEALEDEDFATKLIFSDEATFHLSGNVNHHNVQFWGTENLRAVMTIEKVHQRWMFSVQCHKQRCTARFSSLSKLWPVNVNWICCSCGCSCNSVLTSGILSSNKTGHPLIGISQFVTT